MAADATAEVFKTQVARSTLEMLRGVVAGSAALEAKCDEIGALLDNVAVAPSAETAPSTSPSPSQEVVINDASAPSVKEMVLRAVRQDSGTSSAPVAAAAAAPVPEPDPLKRNALLAVRQLSDAAARQVVEAAPETDAGEYVPYRSPDLDYTVWVNKANPRNSYYEYHKAK